MPHRTIFGTSLPFLAIAAFVTDAELVCSEELTPYAALTIALGSSRGTIYFKPDGEEFDVVATLDADGHPLRLVASLRPGQGILLSAPPSSGAPTPVAEVRPVGDTVAIVDHSAAETVARPTSDVDLSSGP